MRKLLRYEFSQSYLPLAVISLAFLICMLGISVIVKYNTLHTLGLGIMQFILGLCITGAVLLCFILIIWQILLIISTFGKNLFGDYGYLLFCVPMGIDTILLAKILNCFILIGASLSFFAFVGVGSLVFIADINPSVMFSVLGENIAHFFLNFNETRAFFTLYAITSIFGFTLEFLMYILLTLALLNMWRVSSFRFVVGLLLFFGIVICGNIIGALLGLGLAAVFSGVNTAIAEYLNSQSVSLEMWIVYGYVVCNYLLLSGVSYLLARTCIIKKLELE